MTSGLPGSCPPPATPHPAEPREGRLREATRRRPRPATSVPPRAEPPGSPPSGRQEAAGDLASSAGCCDPEAAFSTLGGSWVGASALHPGRGPLPPPPTPAQGPGPSTGPGVGSLSHLHPKAHPAPERLPQGVCPVAAAWSLLSQTSKEIVPKAPGRRALCHRG